MVEKATLAPELLVPRLGDYLVEKKFITREELAGALEQQKRVSAASGQPPRLGEILIEMGVLKRQELDHAITEQVLQLRSALQDANQKLEIRVQQRTKELEIAMNKLAELNQLKSNFVSNISHELRTPLTHIRGYLELILEGSAGPISEDQRHFIGIMLKSSDRLEHMIQDLIDFSMTEHGQLHLQSQPVHVNNLCQAILNQVRQAANEKGIRLILECHPGVPFIEGDQDKLLWVLQQMVDNAIKFTEESGTVTIKVEEENNQVRFSVIDSGIGIPPERINEIFEPFHQLDGSSTRRAGGTGLGLALAQKIIEAHGSHLDVKSSLGEGSTFSFAINVVTDDQFYPALAAE